MNKLLNKTLLYYGLFAIILLLLSAPLYYFLSEKLYLDDVDEAILLRKNEFYSNTLATLKESEIPTWNRFNRDIHILPDTVPITKEVIVQQNFYDSLGNEWEPYRALYANVKIQEKPYTLMIRLNLVESEDLIKTTAILYLLILAVLLTGFVIVSRIVSKKLWKPFYQTLSLIEQFNLEQNKLPQFDKTSTKEFQQLISVLQRLMRQNLNTYQTQREFTENAAHELQTPLAIFQSKLDLLLQNSSLTQEQANIIQHLYEASARLARVNKNLLLLAKIENNHFAEREELDVRELVKEVMPYFSEQAADKNILIQSDYKNPLIITTNKGLAEILVNNILMNAIRHNSVEGQLLVQVESNQLTISNTGYQSLEGENLFKRFAKTSENAHSSGLGLALVKKIADLNNWSVKYVYQNNLHTFIVRF